MNQMSPKAPNQTAMKPLRQVSSVRELLVNEQAKQQLSMVAAKHMNPERMLRLMANAIRTTPQLGECEPLSLLGAMMTCASLGLEANTPLGHAYLIPFKNNRKNITEVQLIIGYRGMIDLARRSGHIVNIHGDVVYEGDDFSFEYGSEQHLKHRPKGKRTNPIYAYCHAKLTDGEAFVVLPWDEVMGIRDGSQGYKTAVKYGKKDTPWLAHQHEMAAKTAVRALFKYLPISIEIDGGKLGDALTVDDQRVDFTQFAKDPDAGPIIEGETIDGETGEVEAEAEPAQQKQVEKANTVTIDAKATNAEVEKVEVNAKRRDDPPTEEQKVDPQQSGPEPEQASLLPADEAVVEERNFERNSTFTGFCRDVDDVGPDSAIDLWSDKLAECQGKDPELHAAMLAYADKQR